MTRASLEDRRKNRQPRGAKQRRYRKRVAEGKRIFRIEADVVAVEAMLAELAYIPSEAATKKEVDEGLGRFIEMISSATGNDMHSSFLLRQTIEHFESHKDDLP